MHKRIIAWSRKNDVETRYVILWIIASIVLSSQLPQATENVVEIFDIRAHIHKQFSKLFANQMKIYLLYIRLGVSFKG